MRFPRIPAFSETRDSTWLRGFFVFRYANNKKFRTTADGSSQRDAIASLARNRLPANGRYTTPGTCTCVIAFGTTDT
ncbi:hypothetical protein QM277_19170, partial [Acinetobacter baumannii]|uniref:hypothetical protein n=1 Tax=Acinetobacter baumannii TaxID=470 RepID=UPI0024B6BBDB